MLAYEVVEPKAISGWQLKEVGGSKRLQQLLGFGNGNFCEGSRRRRYKIRPRMQRKSAVLTRRVLREIAVGEIEDRIQGELARPRESVDSARRRSDPLN